MIYNDYLACFQILVFYILAIPQYVQHIQSALPLPLSVAWAFSGSATEGALTYEVPGSSGLLLFVEFYFLNIKDGPFILVYSTYIFFLLVKII